MPYNLCFVEPCEWPAPGRIQTTVRRGEKWYKRLAFGEKVSLRVCDEFHINSCDDVGCTELGEAEVVELWYGPLRNVPARLLAEQHEPVCREYSGLVHTLGEIYGENSIDQFQPVTVIRFAVPPYAEFVVVDGDVDDSETQTVDRLPDFRSVKEVGA